jgi:uncharacterized protein YbjT (DUF2867 family)
VQHLPAGVVGVVGDLNDPGTVRSVFGGVDSVFLLNLGTPTETFEGLMALNGARLVGVRRLVYLSIHGVDAAPHIPHNGPKIAIEAAIRASGMAYTILRANNFYQNDDWFREALLQGVYPQPIGDLGLSRVDVRDIAEAAAIALTTGQHDGQTYDLIGPEAQTGQGTADIWSRALGRPVQYGGNDLDRWEQQSLGFMPAWLVFDYKIMYGFFQAKGLVATAGDIERRGLRHRCGGDVEGGRDAGACEQLSEPQPGAVHHEEGAPNRPARRPPGGQRAPEMFSQPHERS